MHFYIFINLNDDGIIQHYCCIEINFEHGTQFAKLSKVAFLN